MNSPKEQDAEYVILNPFYSITLSDGLFGSHELTVPKEDWVFNNARIIKDIGAKTWLEKILAVLSEGTKSGELSPYLAVILSGRLQGEHEPLVTQDMWMQANIKAIDELGEEQWLWKFIDVLETGGAS